MTNLYPIITNRAKRFQLKSKARDLSQLHFLGASGRSFT